MSNLRATWSRLSPVSRILAAAGLAVPVFAAAAVTVVLILTAAGDPVGDGTAALPSAGPSAVESAPPLPPVATLDPSSAPVPSPTPTPRGADPLLGTDGRLTVLLLGSDYRPSHAGNRTDAIMVVSVDPTTGEAAAFSVPRDIVRFPLPGKGTYGPRVNGLYQYLESKTGNGGQAMKAAVSRAFRIEVDRYVFIGFVGVKKLVQAVGGVDVTLAKAYYDPYYWVNARTQGWGLPKGKSHLNGEEALIFARSRKGDSDFSRVRRQQQLVIAAFKKVRSRGVEKLPKLLKIARSTVRTDLPLKQADDLFELFTATDLSKVKQAVFGPSKYADRYQGGYTYTLKIAACRKWIAANFPNERPMGQWPEPAVSPEPSASGAPDA